MPLNTCEDRIHFFELICLAIGTEHKMTFHLSPQEWTRILSMLQQQGIIAVVMHGISKFKASELRIPSDLLLKWLGKSLAVESNQKTKFEIEKEFAHRMQERNIPIIVLKGTAFSRYYPKPETRECGDLDCFMLGKKEEGDAATMAIGGKMEDGGYKHSHLYYKGLTIENHKYLTSFDNTRTGIKTERLLQNLIKDGYYPIERTSLLTPSPSFNAIFLIKHANRHFIKEGINLRYLLDWFFFLKAEQNNIDWSIVFSMMKDCHIYHFACAMTALCIQLLRMKNVAEPLHNAADECNSSTFDKMLDDILSERSSFFQENIIQKIQRICRRFHRMWIFRSLADESYCRLIWNTFVYNSITNRHINLQ